MEKITSHQIYNSWRCQFECNTHIKIQTFLTGSSAEPKKKKISNALVLSMLYASMYFYNLSILKENKI